MPTGVYFRSIEFKKKLALKMPSFKGRTHSKKTRKRLSEVHMGLPSGRKGTKWSDDTRQQLSEVNHYRWIDRPCPEKHYVAIHKRIHREYGKADFCEICYGSRSQYYEWSNKDHKYRLDRDDWQKLCRVCHIWYDKEHKLLRKVK